MLGDIIAIAILAVIAGADRRVTQLKPMLKHSSDWLKQFLALPNGMPSHNTIARVFARLDPQAFKQSFHNWIDSITKSLGAQVIPIDGKTLRQYERP